MADPISLTDYAKRRGVSTVSVSKAVARGRLSASVGRTDRGQPTIVDADLADREWLANTRPRILSRTPPRLPDPPLVEEKPGQVAADAPNLRQRTPSPKQSGDENSSKLVVDAGASPAADTVPDYHVSHAIREAAAARREAAQAEIAELDLAERKGELVEVEEARSAMISKFTIVRTLILGVPSRAAQRMPMVATELVPVLDELLREALSELADG